MKSGAGSSGVVLAGAAGVGKTRLAREAVQRAARSGATVRWVFGTASARTTPLGAFEAQLGDLGPDQSGLVRRAVAALTERAGSAPVLVAVDDAHLLDELSAVLVHHLVVHRVATAVITLRSGEPAPDAVTSLWKDEHLPRLDVLPLSFAETAGLLEDVLDAPLDRGSARRLWSLTQGNVLFLRHLVDGEVTAGRLQVTEGLWTWPGDPEISTELAEIVRNRMGELPTVVHDVVDMLALGEPLGHDQLVALTSTGAVETAESSGLVRVDEEEGRELVCRLAHPLYGEVRRAEIGRLRARRLRGAIASSLPSGPQEVGGQDLLRRAVLAVDSDLEPDPKLFLAAARLAVRLFDLALGERLARAAAAAGAGFEARLTQAYALSWLSRGEEADHILARLAESARSPRERSLATGPRIGNLFWTLRRPDDAEAILGEALRTEQDPATRQVMSATRVALDASLGRPRQALDAGLPLLAQPATPDMAVLMAASGVVAAAAVLGDVNTVSRVAPLGYAAAARSADGGIPRFGLADWHMLALRLAGHVAEAGRVAADAHRNGVDVPGPAQLMGLVLLGQSALAQGKVRTAERRLREAWAGLSSSTHEFRFRCRVYLAQALALTGDVRTSRALLDELSADRHPAYTLLEPDSVLAAAWVAAAEGATSQAVRAAHEAADLARGLEAPAFEVLALQTALCLGDNTVAVRLTELASLVQGSRAQTAVAHATALADGDGAGLLAASRRWEQLDDSLAAADAAAQAAQAFSRRGQRGSATAAAARAHQLGEACEGARTPALIAAARPLPLTEREREIVTLAACGLSNRGIAERLVVSVRTVEGHLYRASNKHGVSSRSELAALVAADQPVAAAGSGAVRVVRYSIYPTQDDAR